MALASTQPITEISARNIPGVEGRPAGKADNISPSVRILPRKCGRLDVSHTSGLSRLVTFFILRRF
jgi:hypothetical protein